MICSHDSGSKGAYRAQVKKDLGFRVRGFAA